jgi:hypothetical protein
MHDAITLEHPRSPARRHASLIGVWHEKLTLTVDGRAREKPGMTTSRSTAACLSLLLALLASCGASTSRTYTTGICGTVSGPVCGPGCCFVAGETCLDPDAGRCSCGASNTSPACSR